MILFHYTSQLSFEQIMSSNTLKPSDPWTTMDAAYGHGWYFTDLSPNQCDAWTVAYCWRSLSVFTKVECYLKYDIPDDLVIRCRDHVFMISEWNDRIRYLEGRTTPTCSKAPCFTCEVVSQVRRFFGWR